MVYAVRQIQSQDGPYKLLPIAILLQNKGQLKEMTLTAIINFENKISDSSELMYNKTCSGNPWLAIYQPAVPKLSLTVAEPTPQPMLQDCCLPFD